MILNGESVESYFRFLRNTTNALYSPQENWQKRDTLMAEIPVTRLFKKSRKKVIVT